MASPTTRTALRMLLSLTVFWSAPFALPAEEPSAGQLEFFEKQVRPLLVAHCYSCHSHQSKKLKGELHLDSLSGMLKGGESGPALVPGKLDESLLIEAVRYDTYQMPPQGKLPAAQIEILEKWVSMGAPWPREPEPTAEKPKTQFDLAQRKAGMWALKPIESLPLPQVRDSSWALADLDRFILAPLEAAGLSPAAQTDNRTLIRRLYFDIIGLPPTPEQLARHLQRDSSDLIPPVVDELLASPHFGERWGRHWLDLVRYAESRGHEFEADAPNAWQYRDYVIRALNADLPYDQFIREQIAGDLLPEPRLNPELGFNESVLGTGFWHLGEWVHSPVDIRKDETDRFDNMLDVMSKTFLGLTVSCARCHDHKFDAISSKDYYALSGFLQGCDFREVSFEALEPNRRVAAQLEQLNRSIQDPLCKALFDLLNPNISSIESYLTSCAMALSDGQATADETQTLASEKSLDPSLLARWIEAYPKLTENQPEWLSPPASEPTAQSDQNLLFNYDVAESQTLTQDGSVFAWIAPGQLVVAPDSSGAKLSLATYGAATSDPFWKEFHALPPLVTNHRGELGKLPRSGRTLHTPTFELKSPTLSCLVRGNGHAVACVDSHRLLSGPLHGETLRKIESPAADKPFWITLGLGRYVGHRLHLEFTPADDCRLEILQVREGPPPSEHSSPAQKLSPSDLAKRMQAVLTESIAAFQTSPRSLNRSQRESLAWLLDHPDLVIPAADREPIDRLVRECLANKSELAKQIRKQSQIAMAMIDGTGENDHLLIRGNSDNPGEEVPRRFLEALDGPAPLEIPVGSGRLQLAARINDPANPLTSRVIVNRIWLHLLGRGIVPTPDDFGNLGQPPTNLPLLDHLATRFRENGLSIKRTIREIVLSRTYQMSSHVDPVALEKDPKNLLWHHVPPKRLEGEVIRDSLLAVSGKLDPQLYGPSIPIHLTNFMDGRGRPPQSGPEEGADRRSIYIAVRRNFLSPFMLAFDAPVPFSTMGRRNVSNVPAQALILMNDPFVLSQARHWADRTLTLFPNDPVSRIRRLYESAFARLPTDSEQQLAQQFITTQIADRGVTPDDPTVWTDLAHTLINVKEFIFLP